MLRTSMTPRGIDTMTTPTRNKVLKPVIQLKADGKEWDATSIKMI